MKAKIFFLTIIASILIFLDQFTKYLVIQKIAINSKIVIVQGFFNIVHYHNPGGIFGFLANVNFSVRAFVFLFLSSLIAMFILCLYFKEKGHFLIQLSYICIFSGAIGNMIDRFRFYYVVDFIEIYYKKYYWPAFNIADSAISFGIFLLLFTTLFFNFSDKKTTVT